MKLWLLGNENSKLNVIWDLESFYVNFELVYSQVWNKLIYNEKTEANTIRRDDSLLHALYTQKLLNWIWRKYQRLFLEISGKKLESKYFKPR